MPVECKEEVLPPDTLPSYGGTAELHFAVSVIALESASNEGKLLWPRQTQAHNNKTS